MRPITIVLIVVSLLAGSGAVFLGKRYLERSAREAEARQAEMRRDVDILVAAKDMQQGHKLKDGDLVWVPWPVPTAKAAKVVVRGEAKSALEMLPGRYLRRNVVAGEPITAQVVFKPGTGGLMAGLVGAGMKAVGVKVTATSTASGFVLPGDRVDVILTMDIGRMGGDAKVVSETILTGIRVLGVNQEISSSGENSPRSSTKKTKKKKSKDKDGEEAGDVAIVGKTVALEVSSEQAERLLAAEKAGDLSLALRSLAEGSETQDRGVPFATDIDVSKALKASVSGGAKVIRGGQVSKQ